mgnify:FL=1
MKLLFVALCLGSALATTVDFKLYNGAGCSGTPTIDDKFNNVGATCSAGSAKGSMQFTGDSCGAGGLLTLYDTSDCSGSSSATLTVPTGTTSSPCLPEDNGASAQFACSPATSTRPAAFAIGVAAVACLFSFRS